MQWELDSVRIFQLFTLTYLGRMGEVATRVPRILAEALDRGDLYLANNFTHSLLNLAWLVPDDVAEAQRVTEEALGNWSREGFHVPHWYDLTAWVQLWLYTGQGATAHRRIRERWQALRGSQMLRIQVVRLEALSLRARSALCAADAGGADRAELLAAAERDGTRLLREGVPWAQPIGHLVLAAVDAARGHAEAALGRLDRAITGFDAAGMAMHAAVARRRRGALLGAKGRALIDEADAWLSGQRIARPDRWANLYAPGFGTAGNAPVADRPPDGPAAGLDAGPVRG
jgi:hypothetical protein